MESLKQFFFDNWGSNFMIYNSKEINLLEIENVKIHNDNFLEGIATFFEEGNDIHIVSLNALVPQKGIGKALLNKITSIAQQRKKENIYVETTNDNCNAIKFYQVNGFSMYELQINEVNNQRILKPSIPFTGYYDIPINHIIKFRKHLS